MWLPDWLYEVLPFVYMAAGIVAFSHFNTPIAYGAGALFVLASLLIFKMRMDYRNFKETIELFRDMVEPR